jgi:hypothetical protein
VKAITDRRENVRMLCSPLPGAPAGTCVSKLRCASSVQGGRVTKGAGLNADEDVIAPGPAACVTVGTWRSGDRCAHPASPGARP